MNTDSISTILSDVKIAGTITFQGQMNFDGELRDGDVIGEVLVVGPSARVVGNIQVSSLILHGSVTGDVLVTERCELKGSANLVGSLTTNRLVMDEGASMIGKAEITPNNLHRAAPSKSATPPAPPVPAMPPSPSSTKRFG